MLRLFVISITLFAFQSLKAQQVLTASEAVNLALNNQRNLKAASLTVQQQKQLRKGVSGLDNPVLSAEASAYEPLMIGVQQNVSLPSVYRNRKAVQDERIRLAQLQLQGSQYNLKRDVRLSY